MHRECKRTLFQLIVVVAVVGVATAAAAAAVAVVIIVILSACGCVNVTANMGCVSINGLYATLECV